MREVIFIGLSGLTHNYGGLSPDNVASSKNRGNKSSPKKAALQAIELMRKLLSLGVTVGIMPPQLRPDIMGIQKEGYDLSNAPVDILERYSSSSFMWVANAATVTPTTESISGKSCLTVANLHTNQHRRIEADATYSILKQIFSAVSNINIFPPLSANDGFLDEGAANHMRLCPNHNKKGLNVFVYGGRQNLEACTEIVKKHSIFDDSYLMLRQNQQVIDAGVFHNDVIAVSNENLLLVHEQAYAGGESDIKEIEKSYKKLYPEFDFHVITIKDSELTVEEAINTYFFNSQIVSKSSGGMVIIAPQELRDLYGGKAANLMEKIIADNSNPLSEIIYMNLKQSMRNGGGPACLRLRVPLEEDQLEYMSSQNNVIVNNNILEQIEELVNKFYPDELVLDELRDSNIYESNKLFLQELSKLLRINIL
ncbi:MAG: N-succinylarginine dihydrolase [Rickettsiales bacterium]